MKKLIDLIQKFLDFAYDNASDFLDTLCPYCGGGKFRTEKPEEQSVKKEFLVSKRNVLSEVAKWATAQSPYHRPDNLEIVLDKLNNEIGEWKENLGFKHFTYKELIDCLKEWLFQIPEFKLWNERKNGNQSKYKFVDRYSIENNPDDDFISLDALIRNVANSIIRDQTEKREEDISEALGTRSMKGTRLVSNCCDAPLQAVISSRGRSYRIYVCTECGELAEVE